MRRLRERLITDVRLAIVCLIFTYIAAPWLAPVLSKGPKTPSEFALLGVWFVGVVAWLLEMASLARFRCPKCEQPYFMKSWWSTHFSIAGKCVHCGLPIRANDY